MKEKIEIKTRFGVLKIDKEELEKKIGKFKKIVVDNTGKIILILLITLLLLIIKDNILISQTFQAMQVA